MLNPPTRANNEPRRRGRGARVARQRARTLTLAALCIACSTPTALAAYAFDSGELLATPGSWPAWSEMLARHDTQRDSVEACIEHPDACPRRAKSLHAIVGKGADLPREQQIQLVNRYVNRKGYRYDRRKTTHSDEGKVVRISHWKTLWEFMESGGDCEDYATTKYFLLRRLGFSPENLRVVVVYDRRYRAHHAVMAIRFDAENTWLLETDNHIYRRHKPAEYRYVYAVNELGIWDHDVRVPKKR